MPNSYIRFKEHQFDSEMSDELYELVYGKPTESVDDAYDYVASNIEETWHMDKPVSCFDVPEEVSFGEAELLRDHFHSYTESVDDSPEWRDVEELLYISRFPEIAEFTANCDSAVDGLLYGFEARDVASFIERESDGISTNRNH